MKIQNLVSAITTNQVFAIFCVLFGFIILTSAELNSQDTKIKDHNITKMDLALIRKEIYEAGFVIQTIQNSFPPKRELVVSKDVLEIHRKYRIPTLKLLRDIVKGGRPQDARKAVATALSLELGANVGVELSTIPLESIDKVESNELTTCREDWIMQMETILARAEKQMKDNEKK